MTTTIKLKKNSTAGSVPSAGDLEVGEVAVNTADGVLFTKHTDNSIKTLAASGTEFTTEGQVMALAIALGG